MGTAAKIARSGIYDAARSRWIFGYTGCLFLLSFGLFHLTGDTPRVLISLTNATLLLVPLISLLFSTFYLYSSEDFLRFLLAQPLQRKELFSGLFWGVCGPLAASFLLGVGPPLLVFGTDCLSQAALLLAMGTLLTCIFTALAFLIGMRIDDKAKGFGCAVGIWLLSCVLYDGVILLAALLLNEYPLETPMIILSLVNPVDLARVLLLLQLDVSVLMGYTGASFQSFFGGTFGSMLSGTVLVAWCGLLYARAIRAFSRKDF